MWKKLSAIFLYCYLEQQLLVAKCPIEKDFVKIDNSGSFCYKTYIIRIQQERAIFIMP